jgi:hypothetical protein
MLRMLTAMLLLPTPALASDLFEVRNASTEVAPGVILTSRTDVTVSGVTFNNGRCPTIYWIRMGPLAEATMNTFPAALRTGDRIIVSADANCIGVALINAAIHTNLGDRDYTLPASR